MDSNLFDENIWAVSTVAVEPVTKLYQWRVFKVMDHTTEKGFTLHFVGLTATEGRVSSAIQSYDIETRKGISNSGRIYELMGLSGYNSDAMYVWGRWRSINGATETVDITEQYKPKAGPA